MGNYLIARIQDTLRVANVTLQKCGHDDLVMLLNICVHKLHSEGATPHIQAAIKAVHVEASRRETIKNSIMKQAYEGKKFRVWMAEGADPYESLGLMTISDDQLATLEPADDGYYTVEFDRNDPTKTRHFFYLPADTKLKDEDRGAPKALAQKTRMSLCPTCKVVKKELEECSRCKKPVESELKIEAPK